MTNASATVAPLVLRTTNDAIAMLTLNRPDARNSLSAALIVALGEAFDSIARDRAIRTVVLAANGPAFSAGHDLKELAQRRSDPDRGRAFFMQVMTACSEVMQQIVRLPQPVIAAVHATATAAGCQLVASCDLAVASTTARFATPGVNIGLFCSTPMVALSRNVSRKHAMEMLLTGDLISRRGSGPHRSRQSRRRARQRARGGAGACPQDRREVDPCRENRQGSLLSPGGVGPCRGLRLCLQCHGREHTGARCRGRHRGICGEAAARVGGPVNSRAMATIQRSKSR